MNPPFKMIISNEIEQWRWDTFWTKEFETLIWIDNFTDGDIFFDVGANIGIYSLYCAAIHPKCKILAFEPHKENFKRLRENIKLNDFTSNIYPLRAIISNEDGFKKFNKKNKEIGSSGGQMVNSFGFTMSCSLDSWAAKGKTKIKPNHIKIDIDGQEWKVVQGMKKTLNNKNLKSVLIEVNDHRDGIIETFFENGFTLDCPLNFLKNHSRIRRAKEGIEAENLIFTRRED